MSLISKIINSVFKIFNIKISRYKHSFDELIEQLVVETDAIFFDIGGSMDPYINMCEELFSAARYEFKNLEFFYFHNFIYEGVWKDNSRRNETINLYEIINKYSQDYKIIIVGDASMGIYEVTHINGSIEHYNEKPGEYYFGILTNHFNKLAWLNPINSEEWDYSQSIDYIRHLSKNKMYELTIDGINKAVKYLS